MMHGIFRLAVAAAIVVTVLPTTAMDRARGETRADLAVSTFGLSGAGITVVVLDRGLDLTHPDFHNPTAPRG